MIRKKAPSSPMGRKAADPLSTRRFVNFFTHFGIYLLAFYGAVCEE